MDVLRPRWIGSIAACLLVGSCIAYYLRDSSPVSNFSSIGGLCVSLVGFAITIYTMHQTRRIARESQQKVEEAVARAEQTVNDAREQSRRGIELIRKEVWKSDHDRLRSLLRDIRKAVTERDWPRVLICAEETPRLTTRLAAIADLAPDDQKQFRAWADDLRSLEVFVRKNRMDDKEKGLRTADEAMVVALIGQLDAMEAKSLHDAVGGGQ